MEHCRSPRFSSADVCPRRNVAGSAGCRTSGGSESKGAAGRREGSRSSAKVSLLPGARGAAARADAPVGALGRAQAHLVGVVPSGFRLGLRPQEAGNDAHPGAAGSSVPFGTGPATQISEAGVRPFSCSACGATKARVPKEGVDIDGIKAGKASAHASLPHTHSPAISLFLAGSYRMERASLHP